MSETYATSAATDARIADSPARGYRLRPAGRADERRPEIPPATAIIDKFGCISFASPAMEHLFLSDHGQLEGLAVRALLPELLLDHNAPDDNLAFAETWEKAASWRRCKAVAATGGELVLEVVMKRLRIKNDHFILLGIRRPHAEIRAPEKLARVIASAQAKTDTVVIFDGDGTIQSVNPAFEKTSGYTQAEAVGQPLGLSKPDFLDPDYLCRVRTDVLNGNEVRSLLANRAKTGEIYYEETQIRPFVDASGEVTHLVLTGCNPREPLQPTPPRLQGDAFHDRLTGLPNRSLFMDRLVQAISTASRRNEKTAVVFINLDGFKQINDMHGHAGGDTVLRAAAIHLSASVRAEDTAARLGGDEFALILHNAHRRDDVEHVVTKILSALPDGASFDDRQIPISASIGVSIYPDDATVGDRLMQHADTAMYAAKAAGGHCLRFFDALPAAACGGTQGWPTHRPTGDRPTG